MKANDVVSALKCLEGYRLMLAGGNLDGSIICQDCELVFRMAPNEREEKGAGNVILYNGMYALDGRPCGLVFWGRDVETIRRIRHEGRLRVLVGVKGTQSVLMAVIGDAGSDGGSV